MTSKKKFVGISVAAATLVSPVAAMAAEPGDVALADQNMTPVSSSVQGGNVSSADGSADTSAQDDVSAASSVQAPQTLDEAQQRADSANAAFAEAQKQEADARAAAEAASKAQTQAQQQASDAAASQQAAQQALNDAEAKIKQATANLPQAQDSVKSTQAAQQAAQQ